MRRRRRRTAGNGESRARLGVALALAGLLGGRVVAGEEELPDGAALVAALEKELLRSLELQRGDLERPYFVQYGVRDVLAYHLSASWGALVDDEHQRFRLLVADVRVGSPDLDNTNFGGGGAARFGGIESLPVEDDEIALRQAAWRATDDAYKAAVEILTRKRAFLEEKTVEDRPPDFSSAEPVQRSDPPRPLAFDAAAWGARVRRLSHLFAAHPSIQESSVDLVVGVQHRYVLNSEGTRVRTADTGARLTLHAEMQAADGMRLRDGRIYAVPTPADLPDEASLAADLADLVRGLEDLAAAPKLESYVGPVLLQRAAAPHVLRALLATGVAGRPDPLGTGRRASQSLEKKLGQRILPKGMRVWDDPSVEKIGETWLAGSYRVDDEGVPGQRVELVADGDLLALCLSRTPTRKLSGSNGHGRQSNPFARPTANIGCLFLESDEPLPAEDLRAAFLESVADEGLEYGLRIDALRERADGGDPFGGGADTIRLPDPVHVWRVFVEDGREERVRGIEFGPANLRALRDILHAGDEAAVHDVAGGSGSASSVVSPALLFEELELRKIEQVLDKLPVLPSPLAEQG